MSDFEYSIIFQNQKHSVNIEQRLKPKVALSVCTKSTKFKRLQLMSYFRHQGHECVFWGIFFEERTFRFLAIPIARILDHFKPHQSISKFLNKTLFVFFFFFKTRGNRQVVIVRPNKDLGPGKNDEVNNCKNLGQFRSELPIAPKEHFLVKMIVTLVHLLCLNMLLF